jgi:arylsulfatase A-like enzyme
VRRSLKLVACGASWFARAGLIIAVLAAFAESAEEPRGQPNIIYIVTDQQHADMMSCADNEYLKTPAMDSLAANGVRFDLAYCANPVCLPSRVTMMTGHYPSRFAIGFNQDGRRPIPEEALQQSLGWIFRRAGYETAFGGKRHWPKNMTPESIGFENIERNERDELATACAEFVKREHEKPFLLVASFINPHDICYMAIDSHAKAQGKAALYAHSRVERERLAKALKLPDGVTREEFFERYCPPVPDNYEISRFEPEIIRGHLGNGFKGYVRDNWTDEQWRMHRWAYCQLTEMVDAQIGVVLDALRDAGLKEDTVIVFSSDHGDMDGSHRLEHKTVLYDEAARVPLIISCQGVTPGGRVDREHLVSAGIDLMPTLCDYAGIKPPNTWGRSLRELANGGQPDGWREALVVESGLGRMLRTARYKYNLYESGAHREQLIDMKSDPGEMINLAEDPQHKEVLDDHRQRLQDCAVSTGDAKAEAYVIPAP